MSVSYIRAALRRRVIARAEGLCEYCLIHENDAYFGCEIDHVTSEKHGGATSADNLALACFYCNRAKGSDLGSLLPGGEEFVRFFHPRRDVWSEHFQLDGELRIEPLTDVGLVTVKILGFNSADRLLERLTLSEAGLYPPVAALGRIRRTP